MPINNKSEIYPFHALCNMHKSLEKFDARENISLKFGLNVYSAFVRAWVNCAWGGRISVTVLELNALLISSWNVVYDP